MVIALRTAARFSSPGGQGLQLVDLLSPGVVAGQQRRRPSLHLRHQGLHVGVGKQVDEEDLRRVDALVRPLDRGTAPAIQ